MKKLFFVLFLMFFVCINNVNGDFTIYELMPNTDDDANMEYISIKNNSDKWESLNWFSLSDKSGKSYTIWDDYLNSGQSKKYYRIDTSIILNNSNEEVYLHDNNWSLHDSYSYSSSKNNEAIYTDSNNNSSNNDNTNQESWNNTNSYYKYDSKIKSKKIIFDKPNIIVQSGLDDNNYCYKKSCKINFKYDTNDKDLTCYWDFWDDFVVYGCNPEHLDFWVGKHELVLEVCDKNYPNSCKNTFFVFRNLYQKMPVEAKINLQWWLTQNQMLKNNKLVCDWVDNCSINLNWSKSKWDNLIYFWNFSNGNYYNNKDPNSMVFDKWYYEIMLEIIDSDWEMDRDFLYLDVTWKHKQINDTIIKKIDNTKQTLSSKDNELEQIKKLLTSLKLQNTSQTNNTSNIKKSDDSIIMSNDYQEVFLKIDVQWRIWSNKKLFADKLICYETCSVNFDSSNSIGDLKNHYWDFGNDKSFEWINPWYISYDDYGKYRVVLTAMDSMNREYSKSFEVEFLSSKSDDIKQDLKEVEQEQKIDIDDLQENINTWTTSKTDSTNLKSDFDSPVSQDIEWDDVLQSNSNFGVVFYMIIFLCIALFVLLLFIINQKYNFF